MHGAQNSRTIVLLVSSETCSIPNELAKQSTKWKHARETTCFSLSLFSIFRLSEISLILYNFMAKTFESEMGQSFINLPRLLIKTFTVKILAALSCLYRHFHNYTLVIQRFVLQIVKGVV